MKVKWGALMTDGRGKIGGQVASKNRGGAYMRNKVTPVNPATTSQTTARNRLSSISQSWRSLTEAQRDAWNGAVTNFSKTDIFGDSKNPSGFTLYQRLNNNILTMGGAIITVPPTMEGTDQFSDLVLTYTSGTPSLSLAFTLVAGDDPGVKVFATAPQSAGVSFVKSEYRLINAAAEDLTSPYNALTAYNAVFGSVGAAGTKIFFKLVPCNATSGIEGTAVTVSKVSAT